MMPAGVERWVWVSDFRSSTYAYFVFEYQPVSCVSLPQCKLLCADMLMRRGFGRRDCDPAIARSFLQLASSHYPGAINLSPV